MKALAALRSACHQRLLGACLGLAGPPSLPQTPQAPALSKHVEGCTSRGEGPTLACSGLQPSRSTGLRKSIVLIGGAFHQRRSQKRKPHVGHGRGERPTVFLVLHDTGTPVRSSGAFKPHTVLWDRYEIPSFPKGRVVGIKFDY